MGFFDFFKSHNTCSVCGQTDDTTKIVGFDPTNRREFKEFGDPKNLCLNHLQSEWLSGLKRFYGLSVCFPPLKSWNSYSYITLDRATGWGFKKDEIEALNSLVDKYTGTKKCDKCGGDAQFFYHNLPLSSGKDFMSLGDPEALCSKHFVDLIISQIRELDLEIEEINLPFGDRGIYMQGEI